MIAIGYDYGTTTSWAVSMNNSMGNNILSDEYCVSLSSAYYVNREKQLHYFGLDALQRAEDERGFVKSPKRFLVDKKEESFSKLYHQDLGKVIGDFSSRILNRVIQGCTADEVCLTVTIPNCYDGEQMAFMRNHLKCFLEASGQKYDLFLLPEPIAAALYYAIHAGMKEGLQEKCFVLTCDVGGGTSDLSVIQMERIKLDDGRMDLSFKVLTTVSDGRLGGDDVDRLLYEQMINQLGMDATESGTNWANVNDVKKKVMEAKESLSSCEHTLLSLMLNNGELQTYSFRDSDLKAVLVENIMDDEIEVSFCDRLRFLLNQLKGETERLFKKEYNEDFDWSRVVLLPVGGCMRIDYLRQLLASIYSSATMVDLPNEQSEQYNSVVYGALYYSRIQKKLYRNIRHVEIVGRSRLPLSVRYLDKRLYPIVFANMPDGWYQSDVLRPMQLDESGCFSLPEISFFLRDAQEIELHEQGDFVLPIDRKFYAHGRRASEVPIELDLNVVNSEIVSAKVKIPGAEEDGSDFYREFKVEDVVRKS